VPSAEQRLLANLMAQADEEDIAELTGRSAQQLSLLSGWRWAVVARFVGNGYAQVLAFADRGKLLPGFTYPLAIAPCREVEGTVGVRHIDRVMQRFEEDQALVDLGVQHYAGLVYRRAGQIIGHVFLMHDHALTSQQALQVDPLLQLAAVHIGSRIELAQLRALMRDWQGLAETDELTGLPNRRAFEREVALQLSLLAQGSRQDSLLAIIDVNGLKKVNDQRGHVEGDRLLALVGDTLRKQLRDGQDQVFRIGGDEFALLTDSPGATCEPWLRARTDEWVATMADAGFADAGLSIGFALSSEVEGQREAWLAKADARMYSAKLAAKAARASVA
jgi:diguanylate cyclase (GGDEF)-like protein